MKARWIQPSPIICWEASDQRRDMKRHSGMGGVSCIWMNSAQNREPSLAPRSAGSACQESISLRLRLWQSTSTFVYLHGEPSTCSIEVAYQAAEANHPGLGREGSPLRRMTRRQGQAFRPEAAKSPNRKGITPGNVDRSGPIPQPEITGAGVRSAEWSERFQ